jgi:hypothetical protein
MEKELIKNENKEILTIDSREVAKMIEKDHSHLMRDIKNYIKVLNDHGLNSSNYFIESNYQNKGERKYKRYLITLKGVKYLIDNIRKGSNLILLIKYYNDNSINKIKPIILSNRYEIEFGQLLQKIYKDITIFIPQYNCNKYKIDFYNPEYKLAIEYDEEQHNYQYEQDRIREEKIYNKLHCNFIRITKGQELEGINKINKYVLNI